MSDPSIEPAIASHEAAEAFVDEFEVLDRPEYGTGHFTALATTGSSHFESD